MDFFSLETLVFEVNACGIDLKKKCFQNKKDIVHKFREPVQRFVNKTLLGGLEILVNGLFSKKILVFGVYTCGIDLKKKYFQNKKDIVHRFWNLLAEVRLKKESC